MTFVSIKKEVFWGSLVGVAILLTLNFSATEGFSQTVEMLFSGMINGFAPIFTWSLALFFL